MTPHWRECEAPLRRTQRDGADETIPGGCFPSRLSPRRMSGTTVGRILSHPLLWSTHARHRSNPQEKKQHRHSGIFRVADLGPGTMPRGKYPESPAPAGSHALISRTPTPGGMLHANLGLPRPPPRNFQPPLPRFPSRLSLRLPAPPQSPTIPRCSCGALTYVILTGAGGGFRLDYAPWPP